MSNLIEIQSQIEKLQKQAAEIKTREFNKTVLDILAKMKAFGITFKDLQPAKGRGAKSRLKAGVSNKSNPDKVRRKGIPGVKGVAVVPAKFRGPNGETWSGRGLTPRWLTQLVAQGQTKEEFAIKN
jgi:DNA-binding protein H-NS